MDESGGGDLQGWRSLEASIVPEREKVTRASGHVGRPKVVRPGSCGQPEPVSPRCRRDRSSYCRPARDGSTTTLPPEVCHRDAQEIPAPCRYSPRRDHRGADSRETGGPCAPPTRPRGSDEIRRSAADGHVGESRGRGARGPASAGASGRLLRRGTVHMVPRVPARGITAPGREKPAGRSRSGSSGAVPARTTNRRWAIRNRAVGDESSQIADP
jgi:hypothetical protein